MAAPCAISMELSQSEMLAPFPALKLMVFFTPKPTLFVPYREARFCLATSVLVTVVFPVSLDPSSVLVPVTVTVTDSPTEMELPR
mgnify:CR=1 FL=1